MSPGEVVEFSYSVTINHSDAVWATRLDHYMNFGSQELQYEQILVVMAITFTVSLFGCAAMCSAMRTDDEILGQLRQTYRQRLRKARRRVRSIRDKTSYGNVS